MYHHVLQIKKEEEMISNYFFVGRFTINSYNTVSLFIGYCILSHSIVRIDCDVLKFVQCFLLIFTDFFIIDICFIVF